MLSIIKSKLNNTYKKKALQDAPEVKYSKDLVPAVSN
jgi:hypothetical protein